MHSVFTELAGLGEELQPGFSQQPLSMTVEPMDYSTENPSLLWKQVVAIVATYAFVAVVTYVIIKVVNLFFKIRATEEEESVGLDLTMHGEKAYQD